MAKGIPPLVAVDTETGEVRFVDEPPADATFVVVVPLTVPLLVPDNRVGVCFACGRAVQFRPQVAVDFPKVCMDCVPAWVEGMENPS